MEKNKENIKMLLDELKKMSDSEILEDLKEFNDSMLINNSMLTKDIKYIAELLNRLETLDKELRKNVGCFINKGIINRWPNLEDTEIDEVIRVKKPVFPINTIPVNIRDYILEVAESLQVPVEMVAVTALAVFSTCLQGKYIVDIKTNWKQPLNLFCVIIAPPSEKKSPVINLMTRPILDYEKSENERLKPLILKSKIEKEMLEKKANDKRKNKESISELVEELVNFKEINEVRVFTDDVTSEKLVSLLASNNNVMSVISTEGGIFDIMNGKYSQNPNIDVYLKGYSGDYLRVDRVGRDSEAIDNPILSMLLAIQPAVLNKITKNKDFNGRGLVARFLYCIPDSLVGKRRFETAPISQEAEKRYQTLVKECLTIKSKEEKVLHLTKEAKAEFEKFFDEIEYKQIEEYASITEWCGKLLGNTARIAGILTLINNVNAEKIEKTDVINAILISRYFLQNVINIFMMNEFSKYAQDILYVLEYIEEKELYFFKIRDIVRGRRKYNTNEEVEPILNELCDRKYIFYDSSNKAYFVNPQLYIKEENCHAVTQK